MSADYYRNLLAEWSMYKNRHSKTQIKVSKQLGWAPATLGLYLSGKRELTNAHGLQLANLFDCDIRRLLPGMHMQTREYPVAFTVSGNPSPQPVKKIRRTDKSRAVWCDVDIWIEGAALAVPAGTTIIVQPPEYVQNDPLWPTMNKRYWLIQSKTRNARIVLSAEKPKVKRGETLWHLEGTLFV